MPSPTLKLCGANHRNRNLAAEEVDEVSPICELYEHGVSLNVMSKSFGLAGLRIGWIATRDKAVLSAMAAYKDYVSIW